ncbi:MAG: amidohydrolase family protein [Desulfobacteraceae bacterium]|nr:amidohydrolase family protein [Desulfobacteraceae bacterium]
MNHRFKDCKIIQSTGDPAVHRAGRVLVSPWRIIENGYVRVENNRVVEVGRCASGPHGIDHCIDHGPGVLMPGLVNAHLHLELTALKGAVPFDKGFQAWVAELLVKREALGEGALKDAAGTGIDHLMASGTLGIGEISTLGITRDIAETSGLSGVWFQEMLGSTPGPFDFACDASGELSCSLAGHAPHTSSPDLLTRLKKRATAKQLPFSIHVAESSDESRFLETGRGDWADFLTLRGIDFSSWPLPAVSPVDYLDRLGILDPLTVAVHLLRVDDRDLEILKRKGVKTVVCPRSNLNLHNRLPDIQRLLDRGLTPGLGTDSLASNDSLSMADEMAFVARNYPGISPKEILAMATVHGAAALGLAKRMGTLLPGRAGAFLYLPVEASTTETLLETITGHE